MASSPFPRITIANLEGRAHPTQYRQSQLKSLHQKLIQAKDNIKAIIQAELGHTKLEADFEFSLVLLELRSHYTALNWKKELAVSRQVELGNDNLDRTKPVGIVYIVPSTHTPLYSALSPICAAIAAGNCIIFEEPTLPRNLLRLTSVLQKTLYEALDVDTFAISDNRPTEDFLEFCKLVIQTPDGDRASVGQRCISPASKRTLAIVDRTANVEDAARSIISARFSRMGSSPYAPDVVLVNEFMMGEFVGLLLKLVKPSKVDPDEDFQEISLGGLRKSWTDGQKLVNAAEQPADMELLIRGSRGTIINILNRDSTLLSAKIKGPVLLIHAISSLDDGIDFANNNAVENLAASFVFAALPEANYLANFIGSNFSFVNQIPAELLVGPVAPLHHSPSIHPRYTISMFQDPRPQLLQKSEMTRLVEKAQEGSINNQLEGLGQTLESALPDMDRKAGKPGEFFGDALILALTLFAIPALAGLGFAARWSMLIITKRLSA